MVLVDLWSLFLIVLVSISAWISLLTCDMMATWGFCWAWYLFLIHLWLLHCLSLPPIGRSDHVVIQCRLAVCPKVLPPATRLRRVWKYDQVDSDKVNHALSQLDWSPVVAAPSVDNAWSTWKSMFLAVVNKHIPSKVIGRARSRPP